MLHSIFHSVDHMLDERESHHAISSEEILEDENMVEETLDADDTVMEQESPGDDDTVENTDSTNIPPSSKFRCDECGKSFATNKTLRRHIRKIHNRALEPLRSLSNTILEKKSSRVCCSDCGVWFSANKNLLRHIRTSTTHKQRVQQNMKEASNPELRNINIEIVELSRIENTTENINVEHPSIMNPPEGLSFVDSNAVDEKFIVATNHRVEELSDTEISLEGIKVEETDENFAYPNPDDLRISHNTSMELDTTSNPKENVEGTSSQEHIVQQKKYPCEECGQQFTKKSNVYRHMRRIHHVRVDLQKPKDVVIPVVQEIMYTTQMNKRFTCEKCDQTYTKKCNLQRHVRNVHSKQEVLNSEYIKNIKCDFCGQMFARRSSLLRHMRRKHHSKLAATLASSKIKVKSSTSHDHESVLIVDKNLRLNDYPFLKNMLPASYEYNLKFYSAITDKNFPYKCFTATIQFHCSTVSETKYWVMLFEQANKLSFKCVNVHASPENDENFSRLQYRCAAVGCPAVLSLAANSANVQHRNLLRVTVRIVHKHNHKWDPPRLDLSQLVEAVIEEQDLIDDCDGEPPVDRGSEQVNLVSDPAYYAESTTMHAGHQQPVMTFYFNKFGNSYVTQNVSLLPNGTGDSLSGLVLRLDENKLVKAEENGQYDAIGQFKRVCGDMTVMIEQDPQYFAEAVQQFETSFDRICNSKCDLLKALREFGKSDERARDASEDVES